METKKINNTKDSRASPSLHLCYLSNTMFCPVSHPHPTTLLRHQVVKTSMPSYVRSIEERTEGGRSYLKIRVPARLKMFMFVTGIFPDV